MQIKKQTNALNKFKCKLKSQTLPTAFKVFATYFMLAQ